MMRVLRHPAILAVLALALAATSCRWRDLYEPHVTPVKVIVSMDWRALRGAPTGASVCFYPENGGKPYTFQTNSVMRTVCYVPSGYYTVIVYNRTPVEYGSMAFLDMDRLGEAHTELFQRSYSWISYKADSMGVTTYQPETIVIGRTDHFLVHDVADYYEKWDGTETTKALFDPSMAGEDVDSVLVETKPVVYDGTVNLRIHGIHNVKSLRAYFSGLSRGAYIATRDATEEPATFVLESWQLSRDATDYTKGFLTGTFDCFGQRPSCMNPKHRDNNHLVVEFMLVDGKTVVRRDFSVGERILQNSQEMTVTLTVGLNDGTGSPDDPENNPIDIPDVVPEEGEESGFDISMEDWPDAEDAIIAV